jgi:hypothetical protein
MSKPVQEAKGPQQIRCGNGDDGCGRECRIIKVHKGSQQVEAENWNPAAHLCLPCCNKLAYDWHISFEDVDILLVAKHNAKAGKMGKPGTKEEVMAILERAGVKFTARQPANYYRPSAVPVGDRS